MAYISINDADLLTSLTGNEKIPISNGNEPLSVTIETMSSYFSSGGNSSTQIGAIGEILDYINDDTEMNEAITLVNQING